MKTAQAVTLCACLAMMQPPTLAQDREFICGEGTTAHGETVPSTVAFTERGQEIHIILWASNYFDDQTNNTSQDRCEIVSDKFQRYLDNDLLKYISTGIFNDLEVICVARSLGGSCSESDIIVTLPPDVDRFEALDTLLNLRRLAAGRPLYLTDNLIFYRDGEVYVNFDVLVGRASEVDVQDF